MVLRSRGDDRPGSAPGNLRSPAAVRRARPVCGGPPARAQIQPFRAVTFPERSERSVRLVRARYDAEGTVAAFAARLKDAVDLDAVRDDLTEDDSQARPAGTKEQEMARQTSISASAIIPAPPERVWEIASDTSRYSEWVENTLQVLHTDGPARLGATMEELTRIAGPWKSVTRWRVTQFDPPRRQTQEGEGVSTAKGMAVIIELSPAGQDTSFTLTLRYTPRFGLIGAVIDRAVRGSISRSQQRSAQAFATLVACENS